MTLEEDNELGIQVVGEIPRYVIDKLGIKLPTSIVKITNGAIKHVKEDHPKDFDLYFSRLKEIIESPDYAGCYRSGKLEFIKVFDDHVLVGLNIKEEEISISSFYKVNWVKVDTRVRRGRLIKLT